MGFIRIFERGDDVRRFDESMKKAKEGLMEACDIWQEMKDQFSERGYGERSSYRRREDWDGYEERRSRDSRGRYM